MWDLETLERMNEEAVRQWHERNVERSQREQTAAEHTRPDPVWPLDTLARMLSTGPPSLGMLLDMILNVDVIAAFHKLVQEFLPEHEAEIMAQEGNERITVFRKYFEPKYFPLSGNFEPEEFTLGDFLGEIPVDLMGFSYEDYHSFHDIREGYTLMLGLVESPYVSDDEDDRVPILEEVAKLCGRDILDRIPDKGFSVEELDRCLGKTRYAGIVDFARWVHGETGCWQLDASYDEYSSEVWSPRVVAGLTEQWPRVLAIQDNIQNQALWLEEDSRYRLLQVLAILLDRPELCYELGVPKEQLSLPLEAAEKPGKRRINTDDDE
ncbi:MAG: hypothetical protein PHQ43_10775 [Dehalococcoidales bacterium]|nr:hypothetical protein [Dehalococcoidales bacterium]